MTAWSTAKSLKTKYFVFRLFDFVTLLMNDKKILTTSLEYFLICPKYVAKTYLGY